MHEYYIKLWRLVLFRHVQQWIQWGERDISSTKMGKFGKMAFVTKSNLSKGTRSQKKWRVKNCRVDKGHFQENLVRKLAQKSDIVLQNSEYRKPCLFWKNVLYFEKRFTRLGNMKCEILQGEWKYKKSLQF